MAVSSVLIDCLLGADSGRCGVELEMCLLGVLMQAAFPALVARDAAQDSSGADELLGSKEGRRRNRPCQPIDATAAPRPETLRVQRKSTVGRRRLPTFLTSPGRKFLISGIK